MEGVKRKSGSIRWDESCIEEHNKLRGTRQKIDEPPTPYKYMNNGDHEEDASDCGSMSSARLMDIQGGDEIKHQWETVHAQLNYHEQLRNAQTDKTDQTNSVSPLFSGISHPLVVNTHHISLSHGILKLDDSMITSSRTDSEKSVRLGGEKPSASDEPFASESFSSTIPPHTKEEKEQFKQKRNAHYNEYQVLKALRDKQQKLDDEEDDEEEDDDED